jgi:predicted nucleotidyltransferase component of viral defense system
MISVEEVKRLAVALGVDPPIVDHDYVLGCFLHFLSLQPAVKTSWIFKGGTSLRKCYFDGYRFSEDLDFTVVEKLTVPEVRRVLRGAIVALQDATGIRTDERDIVVEVIADDYEKEAIEARAYYRGPWYYGGTPAAFKIHLNRDERLAFPPNELSVMHPYSDKSDMPVVSIRVYALEEIMAEKLRAFSGQRKHAIARDLYDICYLSKNKTDIERALGVFPKKCQIKGIVPAEIDLAAVIRRESEYELNWGTNLEYLIPANMRIAFREAWNTSVELLKKAVNK